MTARRKHGRRRRGRPGIAIQNEDRLVRVALVDRLLRDDGVRTRQVIEHGVIVAAEVASSEARPDDGSLRNLVGNPNSW